MKVFVVLAFAAFLGVNATPTLTAEQEWQNFKLEHGKTYATSAEEVLRLGIYQENVQKIQKHNELYDQGLVSYRLKVNQFADMTGDEVRNQYTGYKAVSKRDVWDNIKIVPYQPSGASLADTVDWRTSGAVTAVKNQGNCGSCWSFSSTGALEGQVYLKTGSLVSISEQNLMDCSTTAYSNDGCNGGNMYGAFAYVINNLGIDSESYYPYEAAMGQCRYNVDGNVTSASYIQYIASGDEATLKAAVSAIGPISVAMDVEDDFSYYESGVYYNAKCSSTELNHGVLVVGYGTENGEDYWLVKNSWSANWGEAGYIKMARNKNNNCGIATEGVVAIL